VFVGTAARVGSGSRGCIVSRAFIATDVTVSLGARWRLE
jgi:hypothetical protein